MLRKIEFWSSVRPRSRTVVENTTWGKVSASIGKSTLANCLRPPSQINWVLDGFRSRRFEATHLERASKAEQISRTEATASAALQWMYACTCMSSAYSWCRRPHDRIRELISAVYRTQSKGPKTDPCGTPNRAGTQKDLEEPTTAQ